MSKRNNTFPPLPHAPPHQPLSIICPSYSRFWGAIESSAIADDGPPTGIPAAGATFEWRRLCAAWRQPHQMPRMKMQHSRHEPTLPPAAAPITHTASEHVSPSVPSGQMRSMMLTGGGDDGGGGADDDADGGTDLALGA